MNKASMADWRQETSPMVLPEEVENILVLHAAGWKYLTIAKHLGISRNTVKRYIAAGGFVVFRSPERKGQLDSLKDWLEQRFLVHHGNAEVVRQELQAEKQIIVSLRTVERAVAEWRRDLAIRGKATVRYETPPGDQAQIDFGERQVMIAGEMVSVHLFVLVLSHSRRIYVEAFPNQKQESWLKGTENAFRRFDGIPRTILTDNAKALVVSHDVRSREVEFGRAFLAFSRHWGFVPRACAPYRARTKGKVESAVGYVKHNAVAGRSFTSWEALEAHLEWWMDQIADQRELQDLGATPLQRFELEQSALSPLRGRPDFLQERELSRKVHQDLCVEVDANHYSVPWQHIGQTVTVAVRKDQVVITSAGKEVARHDVSAGRGARVINARHCQGLTVPGAPKVKGGELARPMGEYAAAVEVQS